MPIIMVIVDMDILEFKNEKFENIVLNSAAEHRIPVQGEIEITAECNYRCVHCYLSGERASNSRKADKVELELFKKICDQLRKEGCIWLLITGGEPLSHPDFYHMWRYAYKIGLRLHLFTNGSLITERHLELFYKYLPESIEISIYSLNRETYEKITGSSAGFDKLMEIIPMLSRRLNNLGLKTPLIRDNYHEIPNIMNFARNHGFGFRMDAIIHPTIGGDASPIRFRIPVDEASRIVMSDPEIRKQLKQSYHHCSVPFDTENSFFPCSAGIYSFHIGSNACLNLCSIYRTKIADLKRESFKIGWEKLKNMRDIPKKKLNNPCNECRLKSICIHCPGIPFLYRKEPDFIDPYICEYTKLIAHLADI